MYLVISVLQNLNRIHCILMNSNVLKSENHHCTSDALEVRLYVSLLYLMRCLFFVSPFSLLWKTFQDALVQTFSSPWNK